MCSGQTFLCAHKKDLPFKFQTPIAYKKDLPVGCSVTVGLIWVTAGLMWVTVGSP